MRYVIGIDVGVRNVGICVFDFVSGTFVYWANKSLVDGKYRPYDNVQYVQTFLESHKQYFDECLHLCIERQMRCNMRIIEACLQMAHFDHCTVIAPRAIKVHYGLSTGSYRGNKKSAVEWVKQFITNNPGSFSDTMNPSALFATGKLDDLADSLLLLLYYLDTYSNQLQWS